MNDKEKKQSSRRTGKWESSKQVPSSHHESDPCYRNGTMVEWWSCGVIYLGQVECPLSLPDSDRKPLLEGVQAAVIRQLEVIDAGHDTGEIVVRCERRLAGTAHHREDGCETLETCGDTNQSCPSKFRYGRFVLPPIGSLGLPVTNCRKSRRCCLSS